MTTEERWDYIINNRQHILRNMALHDEEKKTRQLVRFLQTEKKKSWWEKTRSLFHKHQ